MTTKKVKKQSIREFVSEDSLKFQLYLLKYANQLKLIEEKTEQEINEKWAYDNNKKINRFLNDATKPQFKNEIAQEAIKKNIEYVKNFKYPTKAEDVIEIFEEIKMDYIASLEKRIKENTTATLKIDKELLEYAKEVELKSAISKEKFGQMLLLIIKNLATMPSFSGYSDNWKTDFFSNAIEKTLLYLDNFDERLLSKRTGDKSKAFAYVTQICFNAFVNIINIRKKEDGFLKQTISLESTNLDGIRHYNASENRSVIEEVQDNSVYTVKIKKIEELQGAISKGLDYITSNNEIISMNNGIKEEIDFLEKDTPQEEKNEDFDNYINDLKSKMTPQLLESKIDTLRIEKPEGISLGDFKKPEMNGIMLIIEEKKKKHTPIKREQFIPDVIDYKLIDLQDFNDEW